MLSDIFRDILSLVTPRVCPVCGEPLHGGDAVVCTSCEVMAPLTYFWLEQHNAMSSRFWGLLPIERASALFWYIEGSPWRKVIHNFKYNGRWRVAYDMGRWYGALLKEGGMFADVDVVVPVPLHWRRLLGRGYNQSEYLARGIARELGVECDTGSVRRCRYNMSQVSRSVAERWNNVEDIFKVRHAGRLKGKHILLVDDVFTTGATIMSLGSEILSKVDGARLSVAVLSTSHHSLNVVP